MTKLDTALGFLQVETSQVGATIARREWSQTTLGPIEAWPISLKTTLATMLACPTPMFLAWGPDLLTFFNDAYRPIFGERADRALGAPFAKVWGNIWDDIRPLVDATLAGQSQKQTDMRLDLGRGGVPEESYWSFTYSPVFDDAGQISGLLNVTQETTAQVVAERERRASDERLELALSAGNSIGAWDWDLVHDRVIADARFAILYGVDPVKAARGAPIGEFFAGIHPDDLARARTGIENAIRTKEPFFEEYRLTRPDGATRWVSAQGQCIVGADGTPLRFPGISYDITDRKEAELELLAAKDEREFVIELAARQRRLADPEAILRISSEAIGRRLSVNRVGFYRVVGNDRLRHSAAWTDGSLLPLIGLQPTDTFGSFAEAERRAGRMVIFADARTDAEGQLDAYSADGVLAGLCVPLMDEGEWAAGIYLHQGEVRHWSDGEISLAQELTLQTWLAMERAEALLRLGQRVDRQGAALSKTAKELREEASMREAAQGHVRQLQKMEAVGQLTGGIAHDFNNMLGIVISGLSLTQRKLARGDTDVGEFITGAMEGAQRAASLTQRLLAFSRQQPLSPESVDANRLVSGLTELLSRTLGETVQVETVLNAGLWLAKVDPNQLENAVINLAVNARDAIPGTGKVTIETANIHVDDDYAREAEIEIGQYVMISVTDTGTGMPPEVITKAFDPFFTTKAVGKGTGLGLSQVYGFIRQSGGHVKIYSEMGHGTAIKLYLPRAWGDQAPALPRQAVLAGKARPGEVILVVEDEKRVRNFTVEALRELGYTVLQAGGGREALNILELGEPVSLLFTDVVMPEMTGRQLADHALVLRPDLKVLYTTGYTRNAVVHNGVLDPGTHFLAKPFSLDQLASKVREALEIPDR
ncbi:ATP-binding protein [Paracoccus laeviglucosivorans]|uniref:histidine kinase n=1 Tax=Paracoccus laeviglucosivorans TaxID=1197861 RepID=A0A521FQ57_9RHOB|nr:ATP-binding protein [Paracoccus laeviglucosivorans]SMO98256.1 PAS/PAC sensor hybrid histidine kinase [Paracoccus laeviglucosivorans]